MDWKNRTASLILCLAILLEAIDDGNAERKVVCYYTNWSIYRPGTAKFSPQNINPYLCTHLIYAFGGFTKDNALKPFDKYQDIEKGGYAKFTGLKTYNKNLKTLLAIGGWNEGSSRFSPMVADPDRRREFVRNAIKFLRKNHFDGLDLDWEYPAFRDGGKPRDKDNYASLVQELREEFDRESSKTGRPRLLLTLAMPAGVEYIDKGYDVPRLNEYLDFVNLLSYDYHSSYEPAVNHHSPLYPLEEDNEYNYDTELTIDYTINYLIEKGASPDKIILGIPTYGRSYTLFNGDATDLGSPADGPGVEGDATREKGYLAYYEICESLAQSDDWEVIQPNPRAMGPYAFKGDQWVGYDDEDIVRLKARYANEKHLGGIMFWTIDNDDFRGKCHDRPYPLIEAAKEALLTDDTSRNGVEKSKTVESRKKPRLQGGQSNAIGRKFGSSVRRSTTTTAPVPKKRIPSSRPRYKTFSRPKASDEVDEQEVGRRSYDSSSSSEESDGGNAVRIAEKSERNKGKGGSRSRLNSNRNRRKQDRRREDNRNDLQGDSVKLTTPEPPTTPDPGTDFKCEDEGFFPHPRDCKKYFWCLDSGPGGLGVVAHQFTCPSGLVFNKAADSCDYPRNVVCPKSKATQTTASTTRAPITAATSRTTYLYSTTRRPTTAKPNSEEEYEYYDSEEEVEEEVEEEEGSREEKVRARTTTTPKALLYKTIARNKPSSTTTTTTTTTQAPSTTLKLERIEPGKVLDLEDEEDPRVIKELIKLIKKAGGIEELEKQLLFQDKNAGNAGNSGSDDATPATISRTLYERVLNRQAGKGGNRGSVDSSYVNGPGQAQFEGLDDVPEVKSLRRSQKPQYVTIERPKPSTKEPPVEDEEVDEEDNIDDDNEDVASSEEQTVSNPFSRSSTQRVTPNYINIRRGRPSSSRNENDVDEERPVRRRRPNVSSKNVENSSTRDSGDEESRSPSSEENSHTAKTRYVSVQRFRSTTAHPAEVASAIASTSEEPITEASLPTVAPKIEAKPEEPGTTPSSSTVPRPIVFSSTPNDILLDPETEKPITSATPREIVSSTTTAESVKLVEDSATEILLTTAAASPSTLPSPNARISSASVSQPRPFGFNRRNRPASEIATTPLPASSDQTRSKVSISSRNSTRSSFLVGRGRSRPRQNGERNEAENARTTTEETPLNRGRARGRGASRYTPPAFKARSDSSIDSAARERARATEAPGSTATSKNSARRRLRRPSPAHAGESVKANELEDSPIVRIAQGYSRRALSPRSRSTVKNDADGERITNIKVFRQPSTVNRDVYSRVKYTRKRNNADATVPGKKEGLVSTVSSSSTTVASSSEDLTEDSVNDVATENPGGDSIDRIDTVPATTSSVQGTTVVDLEVDSRTDGPVDSAEPIAENEVVAVDGQLNASEDLEDIATTASYSGPVDDSSADTARQEYNGTSLPKRRRVLVRRRPVASTTSEPEEAEEDNRVVPRRRKVIKRIRPVPTTTTTSPEMEEQIFLSPGSTVAKEDATTGSVLPDELEASTAQSEETFSYEDFAGTTTEATVATITGVDSMDSDGVSTASTVEDFVTEFASVATTAPEESSTESISFAETETVQDETSPSNDQPGTLSIATTPTATTPIAATPTVATHANRRLEAYNATSYLDSRFVRKKFVGRRPVGSSENPAKESSIQLATDNSKLELASKRRKSLLVRRRPVSLTTARATTEERKPDETELVLEEESDSKDATLRINRADDEDAGASKDSKEFWNHYAPAPQSERRSSSETSLDDTSLYPEARPRHRVPNYGKKTPGAKGLFDSSSAESEEANDSRRQTFRQPRTRYGYQGEAETEEPVVDATQSPSFDSSSQLKTRFYARRPAPSTESPVTETLIPAKKFDYAADAHRRQQSLRTTARNADDGSTTAPTLGKEWGEDENYVDAEYATTPPAQPLVTRLVTSVEESATTERQKILIKTKYSSLTSTTRIPIQTSSRGEYQTLERTTDIPGETAERESANEIRQDVERSTLPIEGEFLHRFTTESHESSTIEIESVFSNLIANKDSSQ